MFPPQNSQIATNRKEMIFFFNQQPYFSCNSISEEVMALVARNESQEGAIGNKATLK